MGRRKQKKKNLDARPAKLLRFTQLGFQMAAIIGAGAWGGHALDQRYQHETPWWTISLSLLSIFASLYIVFRDVRDLNS